ncbi:ribose 5-phosphate isomerase A [Sporolactobacillus terrae]|uniref:Ribose 5-phosphate isomerase A n=1 Tax=Sporolactobacillus terrae TaxID=269673 RepID=A0A410DCD4_9BACL|nr:ribose 5-phosphate isomerase A [Sporolactobacillus terrae]QAA23799.1 ribose 5-phosphate isomerase A [Sporolactobacillus terrae]QAA26770.1 ribose 5-phosphate isomerase A [Sporolactobacillus terrae]UAK15836.1 ribose 5-phosphate isomerase A [Sporolactobacillus terrae]BBO00340.1 ribose-5-phosphate isomerase [Sporolactobacillus terrae]
MSETDLKRECAKKALALIPDHSVVGLGGGSTIRHLIQFIKEKPERNIQVVTPSMQTRQLCLANGLTVLHTEAVDHIDLAFDGCDQVDEQLNALKSGGGIHTLEKLIATMADEYILLVDQSKYAPALTFEKPVVLELLAEAQAYVTHQVKQLGGRPVMRQSEGKDGFTISDNGHPLMDVFFQKVRNIRQLNRELASIRGVIDTSLFVNVATKALIAGENSIKWLNKSTQEVTIHD